jgi:hypothetical protein
MRITNAMHAIGKISLNGNVVDYSGDGYAIDDEFHVYRKTKKLAIGNRQVQLSHAGKKWKYSVIHMYLSVTSPISPEIEMFSGIRSVQFEPRTVYAWETAADRMYLTTLNKKNLESHGDVWEVCIRFAYNADGTTTITIYSKYEINKKTSRIRNIKNKEILLRPDKTGQVSLVDDDGNSKTVFVRQVYMATYHGAERRADQTQVDHIDGVHSNEEPWNFRWVSASENCKLKFKPYTKTGASTKYEGDLNLLNRFENTDIYCGEIDGKYAIIGPNRRQQFVGDFTVTDESPYPVITINGNPYQVHRVVAYINGKIPREDWESGNTKMVVAHIDNIKTNFHINNLKYVPAKENMMDRHDNPETSLRKPVRRIDVHGNVTEYKSITEAAAANDYGKDTIRNKCNSQTTTKDGYLWQFIIIQTP